MGASFSTHQGLLLLVLLSSLFSTAQSFLEVWNHHFPFLWICFPATNPAFSFDLSYSCAPITVFSLEYPIYRNNNNKNKKVISAIRFWERLGRVMRWTNNSDTSHLVLYCPVSHQERNTSKLTWSKFSLLISL